MSGFYEDTVARIDRITAERDAARADAARLREAIEDYRNRLNKADMTLEVMGGREGSHHPDADRLCGKREGIGLALDYLRAVTLTPPTDQGEGA